MCLANQVTRMVFGGSRCAGGVLIIELSPILPLLSLHWNVWLCCIRRMPCEQWDLHVSFYGGPRMI
jgi:hypothetical protein